MRITFVTDSLGFGGAAKMILFVARGMMQRGHEVKMINLNCFNAFDRMPEDIETVSAHITYSGAIKTNYQVCKFVYDNAKRFKPDILVAFNSASNFSAAIAGRLLHLPVIVSERADPFLSHKNPQFSVKIKQWFVAHADGTVFQSEGASMIYPEKLRCRSTVIPNPITLTEHFAPIDYSKRPHTIVTHGRYDNKQKRYDVMLKADAGNGEIINTIENAWNSGTFEAFRDKMRFACPDCPKKSLCMGGCPLMPEIVFCNNEYRKMI